MPQVNSSTSAAERTMHALVPEAFGGRGGIAQYNRDLMMALAAAETPMAVHIAPRLAEHPIGHLPRNITQSPPVHGKMKYASEVLLHAWLTQPDISFCGHLFMAPLAAIAARAGRSKLVIQLHGIEIWKTPSKAQRGALESADLVLCVSRFTRRQLLNRTNVDAARVRVLANTFSDDFKPGGRASARKRFAVDEQSFCILSVGRLEARERYKGHDRIIEALTELRSINPHVIYLIAGEGNDRGRLEELASSRGVADLVRFLGHVPREDLPDLYRAADLFALPSTGEGFGIVFLEAMASGTPALGLGVAGSLDALADGCLGAAPEPKDLTAALKKALIEPRRNSETLAYAVEDRFGRPSFAAYAARLFEKLGHADLSVGTPY